VRSPLRSLLLTAIVVLLVACPDPAETPEDPGTPVAPDEPEAAEEGPADEPAQLDVEVVTEGLESPTYAIAVPGDARILVLEQAGTVRVVTDGSVADEPFLDLTDRVESSGLEQGLLGLAFHPDAPDDDRFYIHYSGPGGQTVIEEYRIHGDIGDPDSARTVIEVDQPAANHNGGMIAFGPDGMLHVALGDGGGAGDRFGHGQDPETLLGTILRLDVEDEGEGERGYGIPRDNPFVDGGGAPEVWAHGLRNPFRFAFDPPAGADDVDEPPDPPLLYVADVGQDDWEWVNVVPADEGGLNHGWPITEGSHCFDPPEDCPREGLVEPVLEYENVGDACAIIGGFVYRGTAIDGLDGTYFYSDWCAGWVRSFRYEDGEVTDERDHSDAFGSLGRIQSFGLDGDGEILVMNREGTLFRIVAG
jgi:glucose/arabinose dehydrogenase